MFRELYYFYLTFFLNYEQFQKINNVLYYDSINTFCTYFNFFAMHFTNKPHRKSQDMSKMNLFQRNGL